MKGQGEEVLAAVYDAKVVVGENIHIRLSVSHKHPWAAVDEGVAGHRNLGNVRIGLAPAVAGELDDRNKEPELSAVVDVAERNENEEVRQSRELDKVRSGVVADPPPREMGARLLLSVAVAGEDLSSNAAEIVKTRPNLAEADGGDSGRSDDDEAVVVEFEERSRVDVVSASRKSDGVVFVPSRTIDAAMKLALSPWPLMAELDFAVGSCTRMKRPSRMVRVVRRERRMWNHGARKVTPDVWKKDPRNPKSQTLLHWEPSFLLILLLLADRKAGPSVCSRWPYSSCPSCPSGAEAAVVVDACHRFLLLLLIPPQMLDLAFEVS